MLKRGTMTICAASIVWEGRPFVLPDDRIALLSPLMFTASMILMNVTLTGGAAASFIRAIFAGACLTAHC